MLQQSKGGRTASVKGGGGIAALFHHARVAFVLALGAFTNLVAQTWSLGRYEMARGFASAPLRVAMPAGALRSMSFLGRVGGVAFNGVAMAGPGVVGQPLSLAYDRSAADGERLSVTVGGSHYTMQIPDWELVPIAKFAGSKYASVVSLFGPGSDDEYYHATYHPAFENTLIGMRLLQADMLLMSPDEFWNLPAFGGRMILGLGEAPPSKAAALEAAAALESLVPSGAQSWVFTDQDVSIVLSVADGGLSITGEPYYYFWRSDTVAIERIERRADRLRDSGRVALARHDTAAALAFVRRIEALPTPPAIPLTIGTRTLRQNAATLQRANPAVYNAARRTMRYAALFRYAARTSPASWTAFLSAVNAASISPAVETPTQVPRFRTLAERARP